MRREMTENEFKRILVEDRYFKNCTAFFLTARGEFGTMDVFAIIGAASLLNHHQQNGRVETTITDQTGCKIL